MLIYDKFYFFFYRSSLDISWPSAHPATKASQSEMVDVPGESGSSILRKVNVGRSGKMNYIL